MFGRLSQKLIQKSRRLQNVAELIDYLWSNFEIFVKWFAQKFEMTVHP